MTVEKKSRKQEILDAALACFTEQGIEATTIDMIRERSGASIGSMYHHFGNKESIAAALYVAALTEHHAYQRDLLNAATTAEQGVRSIAHAYADWVSANPDKARFVLYGRGVLARGGMADELREQTRSHFESVMGWFQPHVDAGRIRKLPMELYGSLMTGPAHDYARLWLSGRAKTDIKAYREVFADAAWAAMKPA
ncbi:TetR/AcrR family transcriptional regulator [Noviherbaspirillum sp. CPCC 100848]|uniref:TetR/AcrR family transcriptional regulator n=1 Tax=Noviherbaspirillum album TaxID=3080276 RepID=A0ABU6J894_9BURK|nr:TetR/AcrR family transcriptional regulator [Noviherbaspirillum sp. CPCC 100848]MEC4719646.1 TetR/AcrR family transcriptional regulator [Noviherbaspirillum sp. CPCC 100848]